MRTVAVVVVVIVAVVAVAAARARTEGFLRTPGWRKMAGQYSDMRGITQPAESPMNSARYKIVYVILRGLPMTVEIDGDTAAEFVERAVLAVRGTYPTNAETKYYVNGLSAGYIGRNDALVRMAKDQAARYGKFVDFLYRKYLGREPTPGELYRHQYEMWANRAPVAGVPMNRQIVEAEISRLPEAQFRFDVVGLFNRYFKRAPRGPEYAIILQLRNSDPPVTVDALEHLMQNTAPQVSAFLKSARQKLLVYRRNPVATEWTDDPVKSPYVGYTPTSRVGIPNVGITAQLLPGVARMIPGSTTDPQEAVNARYIRPMPPTDNTQTVKANAVRSEGFESAPRVRLGHPKMVSAMW